MSNKTSSNPRTMSPADKKAAHEHRRLLRACQRDTIIRSEVDVRIINEFLQSTQFGAQLPRQQTMELARLVQFAHAKPSEVILKQGDRITDTSKFYIILEGHVDVFVRRDDGSVTASPHGACVATLHVGESFGETGMLDKGGARQATVTAGEAKNAEMIYLTKAQMQKTLSNTDDLVFSAAQCIRILQKKGMARTHADLALLAATLARFRVFRPLPQHVLMTLCKTLNYHTYEPHSLLRTQGEPLAQSLCIILQGDVAMHMHVVEPSEHDKILKNTVEQIKHSTGADDFHSDEHDTAVSFMQKAQKLQERKGLQRFQAAATLATRVDVDTSAHGSASPASTPKSGRSQSSSGAGAGLGAGAGIASGGTPMSRASRATTEAGVDTIVEEDSNGSDSDDADGAAPAVHVPPRLSDIGRAASRRLNAPPLARAQASQRSMLRVQSFHNTVLDAAIAGNASNKLAELRHGPLICRLGHGDSFGESGLDDKWDAEHADEHRELATLRAITKVECIELSRADFRAVVNTDVYSVSMARTQALAALKTLAHERTVEHVAVISSYATTIQFIKRLPVYAREELCEVMSYRRVPAGDAVYKAGDPCDALYIVISGATNIYKPTATGVAALVRQALEEADPDHVKAISTGGSQIHTGQSSAVFYGKLLGQATTGDSFGQQELVERYHELRKLRSRRGKKERRRSLVGDMKDAIVASESPGTPAARKPRSLFARAVKAKKAGARHHTVVATEDCDLVVVSYEAFADVFMSTDLISMTCFAPVAARTALRKPAADRSDLQVQWLKTFMQGMRFFAQFDSTTLAKLCARMRWMQVPAGRAVIEQGTSVQPVEAFYVILSGQFHVYRRTVTTHTVLDAAAEMETDQEAGDGIWGEHVIALRASDSFGSTAVLANTVRNASVVAARESEVLVFDRDTFMSLIAPAATRLCFAPALAVRILQVPPSQRTRGQLAQLNGLIKSLEFVRQLDSHKQEQICRPMRYATFRSGDIVFREGDTADKFYIILNGTLAVFQVDQEEDGSNDTMFGNFVARLQAGDSFGEAGLLGRKARNATCAALSDVELISLAADDFKAFISADEGDHLTWHPTLLDAQLQLAATASPADGHFEQFTFLMSLLRGLLCLKRLSKNRMEKLLLSQTYSLFQSGDVVIHQGDPATKVYVILSGRIDVFWNDQQVTTLSASESFGQFEMFLGSNQFHFELRAADTVRMLSMSHVAYQTKWPEYKQAKEFFGFFDSLFWNRKASVSAKAMLLLLYMSEVLSLSKGTVIAKQGQLAEEVHIIVSGEASAKKLMPVPLPPKIQRQQQSRFLPKGGNMGNKFGPLRLKTLRARSLDATRRLEGVALGPAAFQVQVLLPDGSMWCQDTERNEAKIIKGKNVKRAADLKYARAAGAADTGDAHDSGSSSGKAELKAALESFAQPLPKATRRTFQPVVVDELADEGAAKSDSDSEEDSDDELYNAALASAAKADASGGASADEVPARLVEPELLKLGRGSVIGSGVRYDVTVEVCSDEALVVQLQKQHILRLGNSNLKDALRFVAQGTHRLTTVQGERLRLHMSGARNAPQYGRTTPSVTPSAAAAELKPPDPYPHPAAVRRSVKQASTASTLLDALPQHIADMEQQNTTPKFRRRRRSGVAHDDDQSELPSRTQLLDPSGPMVAAVGSAAGTASTGRSAAAQAADAHATATATATAPGGYVMRQAEAASDSSARRQTQAQGLRIMADAANSPAGEAAAPSPLASPIQLKMPGGLREVSDGGVGTETATGATPDAGSHSATPENAKGDAAAQSQQPQQSLAEAEGAIPVPVAPIPPTPMPSLATELGSELDSERSNSTHSFTVMRQDQVVASGSFVGSASTLLPGAAPGTAAAAAAGATQRPKTASGTLGRRTARFAGGSTPRRASASATRSRGSLSASRSRLPVTPVTNRTASRVPASLLFYNSEQRIPDTMFAQELMQSPMSVHGLEVPPEAFNTEYMQRLKSAGRADAIASQSRIEIQTNWHGLPPGDADHTKRHNVMAPIAAPSAPYVGMSTAASKWSTSPKSGSKGPAARKTRRKSRGLIQLPFSSASSASLPTVPGLQQQLARTRGWQDSTTAPETRDRPSNAAARAFGRPGSSPAGMGRSRSRGGSRHSKQRKSSRSSLRQSASSRSLLQRSQQQKHAATAWSQAGAGPATTPRRRTGNLSTGPPSPSAASAAGSRPGTARSMDRSMPTVKMLNDPERSTCPWNHPMDPNLIALSQQATTKQKRAQQDAAAGGAAATRKPATGAGPPGPATLIGSFFVQ